MQTIQALPRQLPEYQKLLRELQTGGVVSVYGTAPVHCAHITAALLEDLPETALEIYHDDDSIHAINQPLCAGPAGPFRAGAADAALPGSDVSRSGGGLPRL